MLVAKIVICILTFVALRLARVAYEENESRSCLSNIFAIAGGILGITFCVLLISTNWNLFTIPKILLFISVCLYMLFKEEDETCVPFWCGIGATVIAFVIIGVMYMTNLEPCEAPEVSTTRTTIVCAKDNSSITGSMTGSILYVQGSISENSVYKYYYELEDGGIKQGTIPASSTTIYFVDYGEESYLETVVTTHYYMNNNNNPPTRCRYFRHNTVTTYNLYVPEGAIMNAFELDAE